MKLSRTLLAIAAAVVTTFAMVGTAHAATTVLPGTDTAGQNGFCPFQVTVDYVSNQLGRVFQ
jgi:hypothetical protein